MLGRISRIKGQDVLVEALSRLPDAVRSRIAVRIVGNAFEDEAREGPWPPRSRRRASRAR